MNKTTVAAYALTALAAFAAPAFGANPPCTSVVIANVLKGEPNPAACDLPTGADSMILRFFHSSVETFRELCAQPLQDGACEAVDIADSTDKWFIAEGINKLPKSDKDCVWNAVSRGQDNIVGLCHLSDDNREAVSYVVGALMSWEGLHTMYPPAPRPRLRAAPRGTHIGPPAFGSWSVH
jgi:hypothetical protein